MRMIFANQNHASKIDAFALAGRRLHNSIETQGVALG